MVLSHLCILTLSPLKLPLHSDQHPRIQILISWELMLIGSGWVRYPLLPPWAGSHSTNMAAGFRLCREIPKLLIPSFKPRKTCKQPPAPQSPAKQDILFIHLRFWKLPVLPPRLSPHPEPFPPALSVLVNDQPTCGPLPFLGFLFFSTCPHPPLAPFLCHVSLLYCVHPPNPAPQGCRGPDTPHKMPDSPKAEILE